MRIGTVVVGVLVPSLGVCQGLGSSHEAAIRPQAIVQVTVSKTGADLVTMTVLDRDYPESLLTSQSEAVGRYLGSEDRGLQVFEEPMTVGQGASALWKATFALDGIVDTQRHLLRLGPIIKALAGAPAPHTLTQFYVDFDRVAVGPETLGDFDSAAIHIRQSFAPGTVEYAVSLLSQDPNRIAVPDGRSPAPDGPATPVRSREIGTDWVVIAASAIGALAAAALVYSLLLVMLRPARRKRPGA